MGLIGIDIGTSSCKAAIFDYEGNVKCEAAKTYELKTPKPGWEELDPNEVWNAVRYITKKMMMQYTGSPIKALSVSSIGETIIPVDREGNVLHNSIMYNDLRGIEEINSFENKVGFYEIQQITGVLCHPIYSLGKMMWIKKYMPELYHKTWMFMLYSGFILYKMGAEPHNDYSLASTTMALDLKEKDYSEDILSNADIEIDKLPPLVPSGKAIGQISKKLAKEIGLPENVILVTGGHDQPAAALGAGIITSDTAVDGIGSVECITPVFDRLIISETMAKNHLICAPHVINDLFVTYAYAFSGGSLLKWFKDNFAYEEKVLAENNNLDVYDILTAKATKGPTNLFLLPHFAGSGTPYMDIESKGAIIGMDLSTTKSDLIKAILEGVTYEMMINLKCLNEVGIKVNELRAVGGGSKSECWLQLKADMMGINIVALNVSEAGTLGVAMLAGAAIGIYKTIGDAAKSLVSIKRTYYPDKITHDIYINKFETYKRIYPSLKEITRCY